MASDADFTRALNAGCAFRMAGPAASKGTFAQTLTEILASEPDRAEKGRLLACFVAGAQLLPARPAA